MPTRSLLLAVLCCIAFPSAATAADPRDGELKSMCRQINSLRVQNGVAPLLISTTLRTAAGWMSTDMARKNYFSHTDSLGRGLSSRLLAFGYVHPYVAENIAAGSSSASATMELWKNSPAHRANMLNPSFTVIGIGRSYDSASASAYGYYWTTKFGNVATSAIVC